MSLWVHGLMHEWINEYELMNINELLGEIMN
jgi:hypothetical protein